MPAPRNSLKTRLLAGETLTGCWLGTASPYVAEIAATAGFDWLLVDGEHAPNDITALSAQVAAVLPSPSAVVVRPVSGEAALIKQVLDMGAQTLLVPMVESAEQARAILRATRYAPEGVRGVGAALARASRWGAIPDYVATANAEICLILQVESRAGLAALDGILAIEGVDGVFIGPADLAADMGHAGNAAHPEVRAAVLGAIGAIRAAGRIAGVLALDDGFIAECRAAGANFLGVGVDVISFTGALRALAARHRSEG